MNKAIPAPAPDTAALVTGASAGIGASIASELAKRVGDRDLPRRDVAFDRLDHELAGVELLLAQHQLREH